MRYLSRGFCAAAFLAAACQTDINNTNQEILGGDLIAAGDFPTVVALVDNQFGICTGTLIAPRVVLTAGHCVDPVLFGGGFDEADVAAAMNIAFDSTDAFNTVFGNGSGRVVGATKTVKNPAFNINQLGDDDIGLIFLDEEVTDRTPSPVDQDNTRNLVGTTVVQVGYGISTQNPNAGDGVVLDDEKAKPVVSCAADGLGSDRELVCYNQEDGTGKCGGDSGGPSFDAQGKIVGVTSFGDQDCVFFGADTRTSGASELAFLKATIDANAAIACNKDGFVFDLCAFDEDEDTGKGGCGKNAVSDETTSTPLTLLGLSFFVGLFTLRRRSTKR